jgi:uncharacterized protein (DUF608 family)
MKPDKQLDYTCMQSIEVWTGTTYAVAAAMLQQGMVKEGKQMKPTCSYFKHSKLHVELLDQLTMNLAICFKLQKRGIPKDVTDQLPT